MYLLDTSIIVFLLRGKHQIADKIEKVGIKNCFISEITVAELKYGAEKSSNPIHHAEIVNSFLTEIKNILPIYPNLDLYAQEKVRLEKLGMRIDEFDLLIGVTAIKNDCVLVTNNTKHFERIKDINFEDWTL